MGAGSPLPAASSAEPRRPLIRSANTTIAMRPSLVASMPDSRKTCAIANADGRQITLHLVGIVQVQIT